MLRKNLIGFAFSLVVLTFVISLSNNAASTPAIRRLTVTSETTLSLNPALSGDGRFVAFESTADLSDSGEQGFHALRADLAAEPLAFAPLGLTRAVAPAISQDGSQIAFASKDDPLGTNSDGNSEIFLFNNARLTQITNTTSDNPANRISNGSFQPSISDDGRYIAFSSNRDLSGQNVDSNFEVFVYDSIGMTVTQLTNTFGGIGASDGKISGNGNTVAYVRTLGSPNHNLVVQDRIGVLPARLIAENVTALTLAYGRTISDDGLRVVYAAETATNSSQVFLWDGRNGLTRQITQLGSLEEDVPLQATISGDGSRVAFATRRVVVGSNADRSVELYAFDVPSAQFERVTSASARATAEVVSSLNDDGSLVVFSFPRMLSDPAVASDFADNPEIYLATLTARPQFGPLSVLNGASFGNERAPTEAIAPASIAVARGNALALLSQQSRRQPDGSFPAAVAGTTVLVAGQNAQILYVSPTQVNFVVPPDTNVGSAEVVVTNSDGFSSRSNLSILRAAPGLFTDNAEGREGIMLNADTLQRGPFDPSSGSLRLSVFATGVRGAIEVSVSAHGHALMLESVNASPDLPGLDEIHVLVPADLRGAGEMDLTVRADGRESNAATVMFSGDVTREIVINEVLADPPDGLAGDANHDGVRSSSEDEFIELVNNGSATNISGWTIRTRSPAGTNEIVRHAFASGSFLFTGEPIVVFGGGGFDPTDPAFGCARAVKASSGGLSLVNGGLTLVFRDSSSNLVAEFTYGGTTDLEGDDNQSLTRSPDIFGSFMPHGEALGANGRKFSPDLKLEGTPFINCPGSLARIAIVPLTAGVEINESVQITAQPLDTYGRPLIGLNLVFISDNPNVATIESVTTDEMNGTVTARVRGHSAGVAHVTARVTEGVTMLVSDAVVVNVLPPATPSALVISQIYGGGNNSGAAFQNDFVELFNRGTTWVDFRVTPYSVQYASAAGNFANTNKLNLSSGSLAPGQYFLIKLAGGTTNGAALPPADAASAAINLSAGDGKVALVMGTSSLSGNGCPFSPTVADFVGYGAATCAEGNATGDLNASRSARRISSCTDTDSNLSDFNVVTNPAPPRNSATAPVPCP
ncbi:MAG: lamin tail domain-containing protein [Pyrinomonadaceae bacterium]